LRQLGWLGAGSAGVAWRKYPSTTVFASGLFRLLQKTGLRHQTACHVARCLVSRGLTPREIEINQNLSGW
jgi:hypothetical protein